LLLFCVGIIDANVALQKYKDAANAAREMALLYQRSSEVYYVMGTVLAKSPQGATEVKLFFLSPIWLFFVSVRAFMHMAKLSGYNRN
jgi:hypothetical protein